MLLSNETDGVHISVGVIGAIKSVEVADILLKGLPVGVQKCISGRDVTVSHIAERDHGPLFCLEFNLCDASGS